MPSETHTALRHNCAPFAQIRRRSRRPLTVSLLAAALLATPCFAQAQAPQTPQRSNARTISFDIPASPLAEALTAFGVQSGLQVTYASDTVAGLRSRPLKGSFTADAALAELLRGLPLEHAYLNAGTVVVRKARTPVRTPRPRPQAPSSGSGTDVTQMDTITVTGTHIRGAQPVGAQLIAIDAEDIEKSGFSSVQDVVRALPQNFGGGSSEDTSEENGYLNLGQGTGINLRGLGSGTTLVLLNGRRMAPSGLEGYFQDVSSLPVTAVERIEVLPEGASALYGADAIGGVVNIILRRDFVGGATQARYGSVTSGPLQERLVSHTHGWGWNTGMVLLAAEYRHRDALPAEARREMDSDQRPHGGLDRRSTFCNPGNLFINGVTYAIPPGQDGSSLDPADLVPGSANRCNGTAGRTLLGEEKRWNVFATLRQELTPSTELFVDASIGRRKIEYSSGRGAISLTVPSTNPFYVNPTGGTEPITVRYALNQDIPQYRESEVRTLNVSAGFSTQFGKDWNLTGYFSKSNEDTDSINVFSVDPTLMDFYLAQSDPAIAFNPFGDGSNTSAATIAALSKSRYTTFPQKSRMPSANLTLNGSLFDLPGGAVRMAVGADWREQKTVSSLVGWLKSLDEPEFVDTYLGFDRRTEAVFGELLVPIVGPKNRRAGLHALDVSIAARHDRYSDFGGATTPRVGVAWSPTESLVLRGTWSRAFKAPDFGLMLEGDNATAIFDVTLPSGEVVSVMNWGVANASLQEETSTNWTFGVDWSPSRFERRLKFGLNYYDIDFTNRIERPGNFSLTDPTVADAITANPTPEQRERACSVIALFENRSELAPGDCLTAPVDYLFDFRFKNWASVRQRGLDLTMDYTLPSRVGDFQFGLNATHVLDYKIAKSKTSPVFDVIDTVNRPLDFKARGLVGWSRGPLNFTAFVNHAGSYHYSVSDRREIDSWTTVDMDASYDFGERDSELLDGLRISLNAQNLFDKGPPFYEHPGGFGYDPANADLLRRFVSLTLRKLW